MTLPSHNLLAASPHKPQSLAGYRYLGLAAVFICVAILTVQARVPGFRIENPPILAPGSIAPDLKAWTAVGDIAVTDSLTVVMQNTPGARESVLARSFGAPSSRIVQVTVVAETRDLLPATSAGARADVYSRTDDSAQWAWRQNIFKIDASRRFDATAVVVLPPDENEFRVEFEMPGASGLIDIQLVGVFAASRNHIATVLQAVLIAIGLISVFALVILLGVQRRFITLASLVVGGPLLLLPALSESSLLALNWPLVMPLAMTLTAMHLLGFVVISLVIFSEFQEVPTSVLFFVLLFSAFASEIAQLLLATRAASSSDLMVDALGITLATVARVIVHNRLR